ncbi:MAG: hypothetical protein GY884_10670, partial [Proteobacteria bacterium]|nr:hypothetical protein [Pseudomonadota bacterium]
GLRREGFVLDVDEGYQTWNQPVYAYAAERISTREPSSGAAEEAVREHVMRTDVTWTMEIQPMWEPVLGTHEQEMKTETYLYTVEVNASGDVVGGQWLMNDNQTLWTMGQVWDWLADYDRDGDSAPDLTVDERSALMKQWFTTPDAAWVIDKGEMPDEWQDVSSMYSLIGGGVTTRRELYRYMGKLPLLID